MSDNQALTLASCGFPQHPSREDRARIGCHAWPPGDYSGCWCGYHVVDGYGCCPECVSAGSSQKNVNHVE